MKKTFSAFVYDANIIMMCNASVWDASVCDSSVCDASKKLKGTIPSLHCCVGHTAWAPEGREGRYQAGPKGPKPAQKAAT